MKKRMKNFVQTVTILLILLILLASAGCINKIFPKETATEQNEEREALSSSPYPPYAPVTGDALTAGDPVVNGTPPPEKLEVEDASPFPYITPDPYRLPYRDHGNWTAIDLNRVPRIPQFTRSYVLRTNSTAVRVNVTQAPLIIDLMFSPVFTSPDQTGDTGKSYPSGDDNDEESDDDSGSGGSGGSSRALSGSYGFVYPGAEISVIDVLTNETVAKEGYGRIYSTDDNKRITLYRGGLYLITLEGDFMNVNMAITTGNAAVKPVATSQSAVPSAWEREERWEEGGSGMV
jgi:hypothetical protein